MMKTLFAALLSAAIVFAPSAEARKSIIHFDSGSPQPNESDLRTHKHYRNKDGLDVHSPSKSRNGAAPAVQALSAAMDHTASADIAEGLAQGMVV